MEKQEYMVFADGSIKAFPETLTSDHIYASLAEHGGVSYYWRSLISDAEGPLWICCYANGDEADVHAKLPDLVKLAAMLE